VIDHQSFYEEVGRRIRDARKRRTPPLTQEGLAELVGLTRTSITNVEKGRQKFLLHTLADIASALQVDPASLLPHFDGESARRLEEALKNRPAAEKEWIKTAVSAAQKGRNDDGT
jgi:transcriptional regulator with XRE-family HTH domain